MTPAPIALFVYKRPDHTARTLDALLKNPEASQSELYVFSDGPKTPTATEKVAEVRRLFADLQGFKKVHLSVSPKNLGLANSIIRGVTKVVNRHKRVIVLEDDIVVSKYFLSYMNRALNFYRDNSKVASIHGWNYPLKSHNLPDTFFSRGADCWGWATWQRAWSKFEPDATKLLTKIEERNLPHVFDLDGAYPYTQMLRNQIAGKVDSWAIRWHASMFLRNMLTLQPGKSLVKNIGLDGSGVHTGPAKALETELSQQQLLEFPPEVQETTAMRSQIIGYLCKTTTPRFISRLKTRIIGLLSRIKKLLRHP